MNGVKIRACEKHLADLVLDVGIMQAILFRAHNSPHTTARILRGARRVAARAKAIEKHAAQSLKEKR